MTKKQIISMIINQANSLNKKVIAFKEQSIVDHLQFVQSFFTDEQMQYTDTNRLTKSKVFYGNQNMLQLERTLNVLKKINNHEIFGTIRKYNKNYSDSWQTLMDTCKRILENKGYSTNTINQIINSRSFVNRLLIAFKDKIHGLVSDGIIEKVFLEHAKGTIPNEDIEKSISDIEYAMKRAAQEEEEINEYETWRKNRKGKMR